MRDILDDLTESQREAVTHGEGPLLVVAGAGSGKTRVITRRVAYLASTGVPPYRILAITFTNKAADEMKRRVAEMAGAGGAWISTFHSMCARMLRQFQDRLGFAHPFSIYDRSDSLACVKHALAERRVDTKHISPQACLAAISRAKNEMLGPDDAAARALTPRDRIIAGVYETYQRLCKESCALDFDDLLFWTARLLDEDEAFRACWQQRFAHILVDEYQDTNRPQYLIARLLAAPHRNFCATGDPDQCIYTWRGSDLRNILDFAKDYPDARVVKLEENFRSTQMILRAASGVIERNKARIPRGLWTRNDVGLPVSVVESITDTDEADAIVARIRASVAKGFQYSSMAIFYRTHAQSRAIEDSLRDAGIPYLILDAIEFYNRKEIKDVVAYLKAIINPADSVSVLRIINVPRRGIGGRTIERVQHYAAAHRVTITEAIASAERIPEIPAHAAGNLADFAALLDGLRALPRSPVLDIVRAVLEQTGYLRQLKESDAEEDIARAQNVEELVSVAAEFDRDYPDVGLEAFLERVTLVADSDVMTSEAGQVMLMTLHSAKGLEFPVVFIAGVQEGLLPHVNSQDSTEGIEEERRLFYVGITRAKQRLYLHWAAERYVYGQLGFARASRFIREIPADAKKFESGEEVEEAAPEIDIEEEERGIRKHRAARPKPKPPLKAHKRSADSPPERTVELDENVVEYQGTRLAPGDRVRHPSFGIGRVVSVSGTGDAATAVVDFRGRKRHLMLQYATIEKVR